jgi:hypothetical protein
MCLRDWQRRRPAGSFLLGMSLKIASETPVYRQAGWRYATN